MGARIWAVRASVLALAALAALLTLVGGASASAAAAPVAQAAAVDPSGPPPLQDSHGVEVSDMRVQLGVSSNPLDWQTRLLALGTDLEWGIYVQVTKSSIMLLDAAISLEWVDVLLAPVKGVYNLVQLAIADLDLWQLMVFVVGIVAAVMIIHSRRLGRGVVEVFVGCLIATLGTGLLANPWATVLGDDGFLGAGRDAGMQLATAIANDGQMPSRWSGQIVDVRQTMRTSMVDALIRTPHQILNYGRPLDGTACEQTYNEAVGKDDARTQIAACDPALEAASQASAARFAEGTILMLSAGPIVFANGGLAALVFGMVMLAAAMAIFLLWNLVFGIVRGEGRTRLAVNLARAMAASAGVGLTVAFVVFWSRFIDNVRTMPVPIAYEGRVQLVSMILLAAPVVLWALLKRMRKVAELRAAQAAAALGGPARQPEARVLPVVAATAAATAQWGRRALSHLPSTAKGPTSNQPSTPNSPLPGQPEPRLFILRPPGAPTPASGGQRAAAASAPSAGTRPMWSPAGRTSGTTAKPTQIHLDNVQVADGGAASARRLRERLATSGVQLALGSVAAAATSGASVPVQVGARLLADAGSRAVSRAGRRDPANRAAELRQRLHAVDSPSSTTAPRTFVARPGVRPGIEILTPVTRSES